MSKVTITIDVYVEDKGLLHDDRTDIMDAVRRGEFDVVGIKHDDMEN